MRDPHPVTTNPGPPDPDARRILGAGLVLFLLSGQALAQQFVVPQDGLFHIEPRPAFTFTATLAESWIAPGVGPGKLHVFAPVLPELPGQASLSSRLSIPGREALLAKSGVDIANPMRSLLALHIDPATAPLQSGMTLRVDYGGTLFARFLKRSKSPTAIPELTTQQRIRYLKTSATMDHADPALQAWMKRQGLRRQADEQTTRFAWRVFSYLVRNSRDGGDISSYEARRPSRVFMTLASDCGGLSLLFVAIMRANQVPARTLFGRWAIPQTDSYGQYHVMAEFFVSKSGWVPVDVSGTVVHRPRDPGALFGNTDGQFLAFHIDPDLEPAAGFRHAWAQYLLLQWEGGGDFWKGHRVDSKWSVARNRLVGATGSHAVPPRQFEYKHEPAHAP